MGQISVLCIEIWSCLVAQLEISLLLWASFPVLMYLECSISHLLGDSKGYIPVGLSHLFSVGEKGREKRVTGRVSETSVGCVNFAIIEIGDSD